jgi:hypothetical protein
VTLAQYQESRIRHFHATLDDYMSRGIDDSVTQISEVRTPRR